MRTRPIVPLMVLLLIWAGCGKKNNDTGMGPEESPPTVPQPLLFEVPSNAPVQVQGWANQLRNFLLTSNGYLTLLQSGKPQKEGEYWVWNLQVAQLNVVVKARYSGLNVLWQVIFSGQQDTLFYDNWVAVDGTTSLDGNQGTLNFYVDNSTNLEAVLQWTRNPDGTLEVSYQILETGFTITYRILGDGTNELLATDQNGMIRFQAQWTNVGGWWKEFDEQGNLLDQGSWG